MLNTFRKKIGLLVATMGIASLACGALPILEGIVSDLPTATPEHLVSFVEPFSIWYVSTIGDDLADCTTPATACATVGAALRKASPGDWIEIAAGLYTEWVPSSPTVSIMIDKPISIYGAGRDSTILDGAGTRQTMTIVGDYTVSISDLTIQNGGPRPGGGLGGGLRILSPGANVHLSDITIQNNVGRLEGGGIYNLGTLELERVIVRDNVSDVGASGIHNVLGELTIRESQIFANVSNESGPSSSRPGILNIGGNLAISDSAIEANNGDGINSTSAGARVYMARSLVVENSGSGISITGVGESTVEEPALILENVTISDNSGDGVSVSGEFADIAYATITGNEDGIYAQTRTRGELFMRNSIVSGNRNSDCVGATLRPTGQNIASTGTCGTSNVLYLPFHDVWLDTLEDNGGLTRTHALLPTSPALDFATGDCPATDQRSTGFPRPIGDACDVGAYEGVIPGVTISDKDPGFDELIITTDTPCYTGPGIDWTFINVVSKDTILELVGLGNTNDQKWVVAKHPSVDNIVCWLDLNKVDPGIPLDEMRLIVVPPKPQGTTTPTKEPREPDKPTQGPPPCNPQLQQCP